MKAIAAGQRWLVEAQRDDGRWSEAPGKEDGLHDVGLTGLAVLALSAGGSTLNGGAHRAEIAAGARWLASVQQPNGRFGTMSPPDFIYDHLLATFALVSISKVSEDESAREPAHRALRYLESHRNAAGLFGLAPKDGTTESSATALATFAIRSAIGFDALASDKEFEAAALRWFDSVTQPTSGVAGDLVSGDSRPSRPDDPLFLLPSQSPLALTAASAFARFMLGETAATGSLLDKSYSRIAESAPDPNAKPITLDVFAFYCGTAALYLAGNERFVRWRTAIEEVLAATQTLEGDQAGSWEPTLDTWGKHAGRIYTTGFALLTFGAIYRPARFLR